MFSVTIPLSIPFHDIDMMMIAWHGHYAKYCELARTALAQSLGLDWPTIKALGYVMPIVHFGCDYRTPLEYGTEYEIQAEVSDPFLPAFEVDYEIRPKGGGRCLAWAKTKQVYIAVATKEISFVVPRSIEDILRAHQSGATPPIPAEPPERVFWRPS